MSNIALSLWFALYALCNLLNTKLPEWLLGVAAIVVVVALVGTGSWKRKE